MTFGVSGAGEPIGSGTREAGELRAATALHAHLETRELR
jgi:hypothetical protein